MATIFDFSGHCALKSIHFSSNVLLNLKMYVLSVGSLVILRLNRVILFTSGLTVAIFIFVCVASNVSRSMRVRQEKQGSKTTFEQRMASHACRYSASDACYVDRQFIASIDQIILIKKMIYWFIQTSTESHDVSHVMWCLVDSHK